MFAYFDRFSIEMTKAQAESASHSGPCDEDVEGLLNTPKLRRQLAKLDPETLRLTLKEYGAWDAEELADHEQNLHRIVWIAAGDISEERN
jgi:hypothetical protein